MTENESTPAPVRVVIVEDHALLREGLVSLLTEHGIEVVATAEDGPGLLRIVAGHKPDLAICDVRLPPTFTDEGITAALEARRRLPSLALLVLSQYVEPAYSGELLASGESGVGYLLKERVSEVRTFVDAVRRVAAGGTALDREVVGSLMRERHGTVPGAAIDTLTARERETIELIAQGRTNAAIARELVVTLGAVEKHISNIFQKLDLPATDDDHRRVLAVLTYLRATGAEYIARLQSHRSTGGGRDVPFTAPSRPRRADHFRSCRRDRGAGHIGPVERRRAPGGARCRESVVRDLTAGQLARHESERDRGNHLL
jgi:DNA-binding NarL/FixJ family response regulator